MTDSFADYLAAKVALVDQAMPRFLPAVDDFPQTLHKAMHYSLFAKGKRLRPILFITTAEACGLDTQSVLPIACALEMIHTYSLIHDDLPAMDDDDYRRGQLTNHKVFGEAAAILAGDALLTLAFRTLSDSPLPAPTLLALVRELAEASGAAGMIGGQMADILAETEPVDAEGLTYIHNKKTGALLRASVRMAGIAASVSADLLDGLTRYAEAIGLAFQIQDDILDVTGNPSRLGKMVGADTAHGKATYPAVHGLKDSRQTVALLIERAIAAIAHREDFHSIRLQQLAEFIGNRDY